jgi:hypothetical protein
MATTTFDELVSLFDEHASMADSVQQRIIEIDNKPDRTKTFEGFPRVRQRIYWVFPTVICGDW